MRRAFERDAQRQIDKARDAYAREAGISVIEFTDGEKLTFPTRRKK